MNEVSSIQGILIKDIGARQQIESLKNSAILNAKNLGIIGDGETDVSSLIQSAIDTLNTKGGGTLFLPNGTYKVTTTIKLYSDIAIVGDTIGSTKIKVVGNIPFVESNDPTNRIDNISIRDLTILRDSTETNTPLLDFTGIAYSDLRNISATQWNEQKTQEGCIGLLFGDFSYYNNVYNCQFRQFNIGIKLIDASNGNRFFGGSCISCGKYGVNIVATNSNSFFGHSVELEAEYAYYLEQKSLYNNFFGCRVESTGKSYHALFEADGNTSNYNLIVGGLDYSTNGIEIDSTNYHINAPDMLNLKNLAYKESFMIASNSNQSDVVAGTPTKLLVKSKWTDRTGNTNPTDSSVTVKRGGIYTFEIGVMFQTAQANGCELMIYKDGTEFARVKATDCGNNKYKGLFNMYLSGTEKIEAYVICTTNSMIYSGSSTYLLGHIN